MFAGWLRRKFHPGLALPVPQKNVPEQRHFDAARPLVFMHVPKTSGTSLASGLVDALERSRTIIGHDRCLFGAFAGFDTIEVNTRKHVYATAADLPCEANLIAGHFALSTLRQAYPSAQMFTILREPMSRLLSHWLYWRQISDTELANWGSWADQLRCARQPLATFLRQPSLACQTDNVALRMLLWPHPLIPDEGFIEPANDRRLVVEAMARLRDFDFVDVVENDGLMRNLQNWIGRPIPPKRHNEAGAVSTPFSAPLHQELTAKVHSLLGARSRLDLRLWKALVEQRMPGCEIDALRECTILNNVARYAPLLAG